MKIIKILATLLPMLASSVPALSFADDLWAGNYSYQSTRMSSDPVCADIGQGLDANSITFGSWDRTRAVMTNFCFQVYVKDNTDQSNSDSTSLNVFVNAPHVFPARFISRTGNNFQYVLNLRDFDPILYGIARSGNKNASLDLDIMIETKDGKVTKANSVHINYEN